MMCLFSFYGTVHVCPPGVLVVSHFSLIEYIICLSLVKLEIIFLISFVFPHHNAIKNNSNCYKYKKVGIKKYNQLVMKVYYTIDLTGHESHYTIVFLQ